MTPEELRSSWNKIARQYQATFERPPSDVCYGRLAPSESVLRLLPRMDGKRILDLGCGGGQNCIALTKMGASCVGIDLSDEQIRWARINAEQSELAVEYERRELMEYVSTAPDDSFDIVISVFSLPYVQDLMTLFRDIHRILKPSGLFVFSTNHPLSDVAETDCRAVVIRKSYFGGGREAWDWKGVDSKPVAPLVTYRRTFSEVINPLVDAGFVVDRIAEPEPTSEAPFNEEDTDLLSRVPFTLICKAHAAKFQSKT